MSALAIGVVIGILACIIGTGSAGPQYLPGRKQPQPQPRTAEEARRWRADWEARK